MQPQGGGIPPDTSVATMHPINFAPVVGAGGGGGKPRLNKIDHDKH